MNPVTSVIDLVKYALKALAAYLELKRETFYLDATIQHLDYKDQIRNEINKLRNKGTSVDTDRADLLMQSLQERERAWQRVSATYLSYKSGDKDPN